MKKIISKVFFIIPPRIREVVFYLKFIKHPIKKIKELNKIKKMYKKNSNKFKNCDSIYIYNSFKKLIIKTNDGFEFAKKYYNSNIEIIKKGKNNIDSPILICLVKNDLKRIKEFYQHYKKLGVTNFAFIDNNSDDGTFEYLNSIETITLFKIEEKYSTLNRQVWITKIMNYYGYNNWFIIVDSDEFLIYNNCENMNINNLIEIFEKNKIVRAKALMIDMYSDNVFLSDKNNKKEKIIETYRYFDKDTYIESKHKMFELIEGGVRKRVFEKYENISPFLIKYPIIYFRKGDIQYNSHYSFPFYLNFKQKMNIALLHYKFIPEDLKKIKDRVKEKNYAMGSLEYNAYLKAYQDNPNLYLKDNKSEKLNNSNSVYKIKYLEKIIWKK